MVTIGAREEALWHATQELKQRLSSIDLAMILLFLTSQSE
jgi:hypothetical protein